MEIARPTLDRLGMEDEISVGDNVHIKRIVKLEEEKGSVRHSKLSGIMCMTHNQCATGSISRCMLKRMLE